MISDTCSRLRNACILLLVSLCVSAAAINSGSLWADEGIRVYSACKGLWEPALIWSCHDKQLFFMLWEWVWSAVFPCTEIGLRSMNVPFFVGAVAYLALIMRRCGLHPLWALLLPLHPMSWYYLNDISPYIIMLCCGTGMLYHIFFAERPDELRHLLAWNALFLLGFGCHFLFAFAYLLYLVPMALRLRRGPAIPWKRHLVTAAVFGSAYLPLAALYASEAVTGAEYGWGRPGAPNIGYVLYSLAGLQGLGLSRADIRTGAFEHLTPAMLVSLLTVCLSLLTLAALNVRALLPLLRQRWVAAAGVFALVFAAVSYAVRFQFWERHYILLLPVLLILSAQLVQRVLHGKGARRAVSLLLAATAGCGWLVSAAQLSFNPYHDRDNYKGVVAYLKEHGYDRIHTPILAQGSYFCFSFYGAQCVPLSEGILRGYGSPAGALILLEGQPAERQMQIISHIVSRYREVLFLVSSRSPQTQGREEEFIAALRARGFRVETKEEFTMFRLLRLSDCRSPF